MLRSYDARSMRFGRCTNILLVAWSGWQITRRQRLCNKVDDALEISDQTEIE